MSKKKVRDKKRHDTSSDKLLEVPSTIAFLDHRAALFRSCADRAVDSARSLQRIASICRSQLDDVDRATAALRTVLPSSSETCPAVPSDGLVSIEQRLGLARDVVVHLREAQLQFNQSVSRLDDLYQKIGHEALKILADVDRSAIGEVAWYAESWEAVLRRWESVNLSVALFRKKDVHLRKKRSGQWTDASRIAAQKLYLNSLYGKMGRSGTK